MFHIDKYYVPKILVDLFWALVDSTSIWETVDQYLFMNIDLVVQLDSD